ncbi:MAG: NUDIX hydrolase [Clostridia bacterium]|nr:NUDIX hydrolase [Clostridia bacterium]
MGNYDKICGAGAAPESEEELRSLGEKRIDGEKVFDGGMLQVYLDRISLPDGGGSVREYIRHVGAVAIVPLTDDGRVIVERQFRYPIGKVITEIPAGKLDSYGEDRLEAAKRELREETGIEADDWLSMGDFVPAAAYCDERITLFLARGLHFGERHTDEDEFLNVYAVPFRELLSDVLEGAITDAKTQTALLKAAVATGLLGCV